MIMINIILITADAKDKATIDLRDYPSRKNGNQEMKMELERESKKHFIYLHTIFPMS